MATGTATITGTADAAHVARTVRVTPRPFRITVNYDESGGAFSPAARAAVTAAVQRWQRVVAEASTSGTAPGPLSGGSCTLGGDQSALAASGQFRLRVVYGALTASGELGQETSTCTRTDNQGFAADVVLDTSIARLVTPNPALVARLVAHEIGHGLGIGAWTHNGAYLVDGAPRSAPTVFVGATAVAAWQSLGQGGNVPIQPTAPGAAVPWSRPGGLCDELMAPGVGTSLSAVTVGALADLGWRIALERADQLTVKNCTP